ncbi:sugar ABC transporter permease [Ruania suaedae]|uniref:carbohydrate ABC transporter permease n=1 Tax=Ruania suaedae TaxID=2897774 RepID=UPI001E4432C7|nr:sugar ABC transporter permease [Ruania suaedae]UFU02858.1 sugar ABC transporter permease [Ruania suaedae]
MGWVRRPDVPNPPIRSRRMSSLTRTPGRTRGPIARVTSWWRNGGPAALLFLLPLLICFGYFAWWPIIQGLLLSFQDTNLVLESTWVGLVNVERVLADPRLGTAVENTTRFALLSILIGFPLPVLLAVAISELRRARALAGILAYTPVIIPPVVSVLLWKIFYDPSSTGLFNDVLSRVGLGPVEWLQTTTTVIPAIVVQATWSSIGTATIIYLAALTSVRADLYEAAELDGARIFRRFWHITLPQLRPVMLLLLLLQLIGVFQIFTEPFVMTGGGPANASLTVLMLIFNYAFIDGDYGKAAALSLMLAVVLSALSAVYLAATRRWSQHS